MDSSYLLLIIYAVFATLTLLVYRLTPKTKRYIVLLVFSIISYCIYSKFLTIFLILSVLTIYFAGKWLKKVDDNLQIKLENAQDLPKEERKKIKNAEIKKKKLIITLVILLNVAILGALKYSGFFASIFDGFFAIFNLTTAFPILKIGMPIGISYYTLSAIGYLVDVYRGKYEPENNIFKLSLFVCYFPQAFEGPIARYNDMKPQYDNGGGENFNGKNIVQGYLLILCGLFKKFIIADRLAILVGEIFSNPATYSGWYVVLGILCFTFQLYIEFSGYINMAEGISNLFGIKLAKNFQQPFFSQTIAEFWRRWHISLGAWCKEYIFYSVAMSKGMTKLNKKMRGKVNTFFETFIPSSIALLAVWLVMGIWHGASWLYVIYGLYYYFLTMIGMCLEPLHQKCYDKLKVSKDNIVSQSLRIIRTFILVNIGMLIFRASDLTTAVNMFANIFSTTSGNYLFDIIAVKDFVVALIGTAIICIVDSLYQAKIDLLEKFAQLKPFAKYLIILIIVFIILVFGAYGQGYTTIDPLYGGF